MYLINEGRDDEKKRGYQWQDNRTHPSLTQSQNWGQFLFFPFLSLFLHLSFQFLFGGCCGGKKGEGGK